MLIAFYADEKIVWYENVDGRGQVWQERWIANYHMDTSPSVYTGDLDGDGDLDVIAQFYGLAGQSDKISWFENTDGAGLFRHQRVITTGTDGVQSIDVADLDGDGDLDVLSASYRDRKLAWYENIDGRGTFGPQVVITTLPQGGAFNFNRVVAADMDADGGLDLLVAFQRKRSPTVREFEITWYKNLGGGGTFGPPQVITTEPVRDLAVADLDGDGDWDILSVDGLYTDTVAWIENIDGRGSFGLPLVIISTSHLLKQPPQTADLDGDGDLDVIPTSPARVAWYENLLPHPGDANRDGRFDTSDLVQVLGAGEYEDDIEDNSTWEEGDWDGDDDFTTSDLVLALQTGLYEVKSGLNASKIAAAVDWLFTPSDSKGPRRAFVA